MIPVRVDAGAIHYEVAVHELPVSSGLAADGAGVVVVVGGSGPAPSVPIEQSARVVLVAGDPDASVADLGRIGRSVPVILERPRLRRDLVDDALAGRGHTRPALVSLECAAPPELMRSAVRDAVGWGRVLTGRLTLASRSGGSAGWSALLEGPDGIPVLLRGTVSRVPEPWIRVLAVGEVTTEVLLDPARRQSVTTLTRNGRTIAPARYETAERLALRRALQVAAGSPDPDDLAALQADTVLAEQVLDLRDGSSQRPHKPA